MSRPLKACIECDEETEGAGKLDNPLYCISCDIGPLCPKCYEYSNTGPICNNCQLLPGRPKRRGSSPMFLCSSMRRMQKGSS